MVRPIRPPRSSPAHRPRLASASAAVAALAAAFVSLAGAGRAQQIVAAPARRPLLGVVEGPEGPVPGARVALLGLPPSFDPSRDATDLAETTADERGRWRADVLPGVPYCGFAVAPGLAAPLQGWFGAGALVTFRCDEATSPGQEPAGTEVRLALDGLAPWLERGPLQTFVQSGFGGGLVLPAFDRRPVGLGERGEALVPALPSLHVEVRTADGLPLWLAATRSAPPLGMRAILPPPREVPFAVTDDKGRPLAGVELRQRVGTFRDLGPDGVETMHRHVHRALGRTGGDGRLTAVLPCERDPFAAGATELLVLARAAGCSETLSGVQGKYLYRDDVRLLRVDAREIRFALRPAQPLRGRLLVPGGVPAGTRVRLFAAAKLDYGGRGYTHDSREYEAAVAGDGAFAFDDPPAELHASRLCVLLPDGRTIALPPCRGRALPADPIDLANLAEVELRVLDTRQGPAGGLVGYLQPEDARSVMYRNALTRLCTDPAGRCRLALWPGRWLVFFFGRGGYAYATIDARAGEARTVEVALDELANVRGTLHGDRSEGIAGARLRVLRATSGDATDGPDGALRNLLLAALQHALAQVRTGADGSFAVPMVGLSGFEVVAQFVADGRRSDELRLPAAEQPVRLRLR